MPTRRIMVTRMATITSRTRTTGASIYRSIPNLLTIARLGLAPLIFWAITSGRHPLALILFACAALTDGLDGMLARRFGQTTALGAYLDPIADKILLSGVYLSLALAGSVPWWLVIVIFGRDVFLLASSGVALLFTEFRQFRPSIWGKTSTFIQIVCATAWMAQNATNSPLLHAAAQAIVWPAAAATVWSGLHYGWRGLRFVRAH
ncbi:MAG TPA: CDP-alcohol phosphatidyltransferase family protein [Bryobacteraceae bacterium]|nr:CDP-alcohol phosphatidyltransferase family protein [Bryobacteraceae bacterium]